MILGALRRAVGVTFAACRGRSCSSLSPPRAALPAALAWLPGWWQVRFGVPLLITTLLLNYIAALFAAYLVDLSAPRRGGRRPRRDRR